jgi:hypothetical protein
MAQFTKLTNNSDETEISALISGDTIFSIPYFQRPYKWKPERLRQLNQDILNLVDGTTDFHFLGAVIIHGRKSNPSDPKFYDVIDGQQRITTLFLYVCGLVKILCNLGQHQVAGGLFLKYLVIGRPTGGTSNLKLHSSKDDRLQLNTVFSDLLNDQNLTANIGGFKPTLLPASGKDIGPLLNNYRSILRFLKDEVDQGGIDRINEISSALFNKISVVQIDVWDPTNGPKIFDSLNSRQEPMTIGDLVRNEIFSKVADKEASEIESVDASHWQPFYKKFEQNGKNLFDSYFFPYGLIQNPNLKKSEVYSSLRKDWNGINDPEKIILKLAKYQGAFLDIICCKNFTNQSGKALAVIQRLHRSGLPSSTYPFLMSALRDLQDGSANSDDTVESLIIIESFLIRRAVCGHEPTGLHSVFKRLWSDCEGKPSGEKVREIISKYKTVTWPTDEEFALAIETRPLYGSSSAAYLVGEYDRSLKGDFPGDIPWLEHVLPQNPEESWFEIFTAKEHDGLKDLFANLIPLSSQMNTALGNKAYGEKRETYRTDSMFKSARKFAEEHVEWTPKLLRARSKMLASWAVSRWPHKKLSS